MHLAFDFGLQTPIQGLDLAGLLTNRLAQYVHEGVEVQYGRYDQDHVGKRLDFDLIADVEIEHHDDDGDGADRDGKVAKMPSSILPQSAQGEEAEDPHHDCLRVRIHIERIRLEPQHELDD